jgi:regulator of protease activity HflC (stomatin/prohibitin superfamily)
MTTATQLPRRPDGVLPELPAEGYPVSEEAVTNWFRGRYGCAPTAEELGAIINGMAQRESTPPHQAQIHQAQAHQAQIHQDQAHQAQAHQAQAQRAQAQRAQAQRAQAQQAQAPQGQAPQGQTHQAQDAAPTGWSLWPPAPPTRR